MVQHVPASGIYSIVHLYQVFHGDDAVQLHCQRCPVGSVCANLNELDSSAVSG